MTNSFGNIDSISKAFLMLYDLLFLRFDFDSISMAFLMLYDLRFLQLLIRTPRNVKSSTRAIKHP